MDAATVFLMLAIAGANVDSPELAAPQRHTSYFAGQSGWGGDQSSPPSAAAPTGDRYPLDVNGISQDVVNRTQAALSETGNSLSEGIEAGIQAANQQFQQGGSQMVDAARNAGQQISNQFQGWAGGATPQAATTAPVATGSAPPAATSRSQVSSPFTTSAPTSAPAASSAPAPSTRSRSGVAPPPGFGSAPSSATNWSGDATATSAPGVAPRTAVTGTPPVQTESGWTSVHSSAVPPRLAAPPLANTTSVAAPVAATTSAPLEPQAGAGGPNFPATNNQPTEHSMLAQPQPRQQPPVSAPATSAPVATGAPASNPWDYGWDGKTATVSSQGAPGGNRYAPAGITANQEVNGATDLARQQFGSQPAAPSSAPPPAATIGAWDDRGWPGRSVAQPGVVAPQHAAAGVAPPVGSVGQPVLGASAVQGGVAAHPVGGAPHDGAVAALPKSEQVPWVPLMFVSLALAGSIGANLFLGWSYVEARHKYRMLVQKTANRFRRATAA